MARIFIYDHHTEKFQCVEPRGLPAGLRTQGFARQYGGIAWTDRRLLLAYEAVCAGFGPVDVETCFRPPGKGQSAHYAGLALGMGRALSSEKRQALRKFCLQCPLFSYVEPPYLTPAWVHAEVQAAPPCQPGRGYPFLKAGSAGPHVFTLQALLNQNGFPCLLTGYFTQDTACALLSYARSKGLPAYPWADGRLWSQITR